MKNMKSFSCEPVNNSLVFYPCVLIFYLISGSNFMIWTFFLTQIKTHWKTSIKPIVRTQFLHGIGLWISYALLLSFFSYRFEFMWKTSFSCIELEYLVHSICKSTIHFTTRTNICMMLIHLTKTGHKLAFNFMYMYYTHNQLRLVYSYSLSCSRCVTYSIE